MSKQFFDIQLLNSLFENITRTSGMVFWIRSLDYSQQFYVSSNYSEFWGKSCDSLYEHPERWIDSLSEQDRQTIENRFSNRLKKLTVSPKTQDTIFFRITGQNRKSFYIRDRAFALINSRQEPVAIAGLGEPMSSDQWIKELEGTMEMTNLEKALWELITKLLHLSLRPLDKLPLIKNNTNQYAVKFSGKLYHLSKRELECLYWSIRGYTAKGIAKFLKLSPRTVENYLEHLKRKMDCPNKLTLIANVDISHLDEQVLLGV